LLPTQECDVITKNYNKTKQLRLLFLFVVFNIYINIKYEFYVDKVFSLIKSQKNRKKCVVVVVD